MSNNRSVGATQGAHGGNSLHTAMVGAACGFVCFLLFDKLVTAIFVALGWYGSYSLTHLGPEVLVGLVFGVAWSFRAFREPSPLRAMLWQSAVLITIWALLHAGAAISGAASKGEDLWHGLVSVALKGALSGFVTAWIMPHLLARLPRSQPPAPPSFSRPHQDVTYEIGGR